VTRPALTFSVLITDAIAGGFTSLSASSFAFARASLNDFSMK
jgi:hypothetical protein